MVGAHEYATLIKTGQYDQLYIVSGQHARGKTFRIFVLPKGEKAKTNGPENLCLNYNAVEVYGVIGGHIRWNEIYGWLHRGLKNSSLKNKQKRKSKTPGSCITCAVLI